MTSADAMPMTAILAALYGGAGLLVMAGTADDLMKRGWSAARALWAGFWTGLAWPVTVAFVLVLKFLMAPGKP